MEQITFPFQRLTEGLNIQPHFPQQLCCNFNYIHKQPAQRGKYPPHRLILASFCISHFSKAVHISAYSTYIKVEFITPHSISLHVWCFCKRTKQIPLTLSSPSCPLSRSPRHTPRWKRTHLLWKGNQFGLQTTRSRAGCQGQVKMFQLVLVTPTHTFTSSCIKMKSFPVTCENPIYQRLTQASISVCSLPEL